MSLDFSPLSTELEYWARASRQAVFWWRDDDAVADTPALRRLIDVADGVDVALAVIPSCLEESLIQAQPPAHICVHGWSHRNLNDGRGKKTELVADFPAHGLAQGLEVVQTAFGAAALPVMVPPWNRIDGAVLPLLHKTGYAAVSTFADNVTEAASLPVRVINTNVDILDWARRSSAAHVPMRDPQNILADVVRGLQLRRQSAPHNTSGHDALPLDPLPIGLLTHHLVQDETTWGFLAALRGVIAQHPGSRWVSLKNVLEGD